MCLSRKAQLGMEHCSFAARSSSQAQLSISVLVYGRALQETTRELGYVCILTLNCTFTREHAGTAHWSPITFSISSSQPKPGCDPSRTTSDIFLASAEMKFSTPLREICMSVYCETNQGLLGKHFTACVTSCFAYWTSIYYAIFMKLYLGFYILHYNYAIY